jgi:hypothetical protein
MAKLVLFSVKSLRPHGNPGLFFHAHYSTLNLIIAFNANGSVKNNTSYFCRG